MNDKETTLEIGRLWRETGQLRERIDRSFNLISRRGSIINTNVAHADLSGRNVADSHPDTAISSTPAEYFTGATVAAKLDELTTVLTPVDGQAGFFLQVGGGDPGWSPFSFSAAAAGVGASMVHNHSNDAAGGILSAASESAKGIIELATVVEAKTGTDTERAITAAGLATVIAISTPSDGKLIKSGAGVLTLTSAGTYQLEANASGGALVRSAGTALTAGRVALISDGNTIGDDAGFTYDAVNDEIILKSEVTSRPIVRLYNAGLGGGQIIGFQSAGTLASPTASATNTALLTQQGRGHDGTAYQIGPSMVWYTNEAWNSTSRGNRIDFLTTKNGTTSAALRVRITDQGSLLLGSTVDGMTAAGSIAITQDLAHRGAYVGFYNVTPIVRPTTGIASAALVQNSGNAINDASTFDGYTLLQVVKALRNLGLLT